MTVKCLIRKRIPEWGTYTVTIYVFESGKNYNIEYSAVTDEIVDVYSLLRGAFGPSPWAFGWCFAPTDGLYSHEYVECLVDIPREQLDNLERIINDRGL